MVAAKKPAPDVYLLALERLGLPVRECLAIEDLYNGVMAARRAGITTLATTSDYTRYEDLRYALGVLSAVLNAAESRLHRKTVLEVR